MYNPISNEGDIKMLELDLIENMILESLIRLSLSKCFSFIRLTIIIKTVYLKWFQ